MIFLIAAVSENGVIGNNNKLPWNIPEDLKRFQELTTGHVVVMGRKTFESILGYLKKPLPKRINVVITRNLEFKAPAGVELYHALGDAITAHAQEDIFVIGGAEIFAHVMQQADRLYITEVKGVYDGDTFFPTIDPAVWKEVAREGHDRFNFVEYKRMSSPT